MTQGEKNETSPATSATGIASTNEPAPACWVNHSATGGLFRVALDALDELDEGGRGRQPADDARRDATVAVEDHEARDGVGGERAREREQGLPGGAEERRVGDLPAAYE